MPILVHDLPKLFSPGLIDLPPKGLWQVLATISRNLGRPTGLIWAWEPSSWISRYSTLPPTERLMGSHGHPAPADWSALSDAEIMLRVSAGEDAGFTYLLEKYRKPIVNFMFRMVRNQAIAEELGQEVFLRVYRSRASYRAEAKFTTWLYRIATNLGVNYARDTRHERAAQNVYLDQPDAENGDDAGRGGWAADRGVRVGPG